MWDRLKDRFLIVNIASTGIGLLQLHEVVLLSNVTLSSSLPSAASKVALGQFHQCSTGSFNIRNLHAELFCAYVICLYFTGARLLAQKLRVKRW
jgi:hypothetical protein